MASQTQYSRIILKTLTTSGQVPTVPSSSDHTDGSWIISDLYEGEICLNSIDKNLFIRIGGDIYQIATGYIEELTVGSVKECMDGTTVVLSRGRQNFVYGDMTINGTFSNSGEIVVYMGDLYVPYGTLFNTGDLIIN